MRLASFTLRRFRSITRDATVPIAAEITTLIGPNNEGKSNILAALGLALEVLSNVPADSRDPSAGRVVSKQPTSFSFIPPKFRYVASAYEWERDYPVSLQVRAKPEPTRFEIDFQLDGDDVAEFRRKVGSSIDGHLPIALSVNREGVWTFSVPKKGQGSRLSSKAPAIAQYIRQRLDLQYVQAVRTADDAQRMVNRYVSRRLLTEDVLTQISQEVLRILDDAGELTGAAEEVCAALRVFVPAKSAEFALTRERLARILDSALELRIDDGSMTPLAMKGDGIVSLVSVGLARHFGKQSKAQALVLAIEEPESHLHPEKACELRHVLCDLARDHQVIVTTHSPSLVQRGQVGSNIVVRDGAASPATSLREIRDALGVTLSHNLTSAELMLLVEGSSDALVLEESLKSLSPAISSAVDQGTLVVDALGGASKLSYRARLAGRTDLYNFCAVLDDDAEGRLARDEAKKDGVLTDAEVTMLTRLGRSESEMEDLLDESAYSDVVKSHFGGVDVMQHRLFTSGGKKWSTRLREAAVALGRSWDDESEKALKAVVAAEVAPLGPDAFSTTGRTVIEALAVSVETRLQELGL